MRFLASTLLIIMVVCLISCSTTHRVKVTSQPCLIPLVGYSFILCNDYSVFIDGKKFIVPMGFQTDLASIPRAFWSIDAPQEVDTIAGAVLHDYLYSCNNGLSRLEIDNILYDILVYENVGRIKAFKYWAATRLFGSHHFIVTGSKQDADTRTEHTVSCS